MTELVEKKRLFSYLFLSSVSWCESLIHYGIGVSWPFDEIFPGFIVEKLSHAILASVFQFKEKHSIQGELEILNV